MAKQEERVFENLRGVLGFLILSIILECCLTAIFFKLLLGRSDWWCFSIVAIVPSFWGTVIGMTVKARDDNQFKKVKCLNFFERRIWFHLLSYSSVISILTVFVTSVIFNMEWITVTIVVFVTTWMTCETSYVLSVVWNN